MQGRSPNGLAGLQRVNEGDRKAPLLVWDTQPPFLHFDMFSILLNSECTMHLVSWGLAVITLQCWDPAWDLVVGKALLLAFPLVCARCPSRHIRTNVWLSCLACLGDWKNSKNLGNMSRSSANLAASSNAVGPFFLIFKASGQVKSSEAAVSLLMHIAAGLQQHLARVDLTLRPSPFNACLCSPLTASLPWQSQHDRSLQQGAAVDSQHLFAWCLSELLRPSDHFLYLFIPRAKTTWLFKNRQGTIFAALSCGARQVPGQASPQVAELCYLRYGLKRTGHYRLTIHATWELNTPSFAAAHKE